MRNEHAQGRIVVRYMLVMLFFISAATGAGLVFRSMGFNEANIVIVYILSVLLTARFTRGYVYGIFGSLAATVAFNFLFTEPHYSLSVNDPAYFITFAVMTVTAIITSALTSKEKQSASMAQERESETNALFRLTNRLTEAESLDGIAKITGDAVSELLGCQTTLLCHGKGGKPDGEAAPPGDGNQPAPVEAADEYLEMPVQSRSALPCVLRVPKKKKVSDSQLRLIHSMLESTAMAIDRLLNMQDRIKATEAMTQERYRGNLLRGISHDLRTPLASMMGIAEMLMDMTPADDTRHSLAEDIFKESNWLHAMVQNILSLTRLRDGAMNLSRQMVPIEEVIGGAVNHAGRLSGREITVEAPEEVIFVPMDAGLIEQVLVNLLDNAVKHTPPWEEIKVSVQRDGEKRLVRITVSDRGSGILEEDLPSIFQMFYTASKRKADASRGTGLGLTISAAIIEAHGGAIHAKNRADGHGAEFEFTLPLEEKHEPDSK